MNEFFGTVGSPHWIFAVLASISTVVFLIMSLLTIFGADWDSDSHVDGHDIDADFKVWTIRNIITFLMMFGWGGLMVSSWGFSNGIVITTAFVLGVIGTVIIGWLFNMVNRLAHNGGTYTQEYLIGKNGSVSVPIAPNNIGKISIVISGALREIYATSNEYITMNTMCTIVGFRGPIAEVVTSNPVIN